MVSEKAKAFLRKEYGDKYFGWDIEDHHLDEILDENPADYAELDEKCTKLEELIRECERMQRIMGETVNAR